MGPVQSSAARLSGLFMAGAMTLGCAAEGGDEGGAANLPDRGISGWERTEIDDEPFVVRADDAALAGASAIVIDGRVVVYGHRVNSDGSFELFRAQGDAAGLVFEPATAIGLAGRDPSVVFNDRFWLAYMTADGIAIATSDDGLDFVVQPVTGVATGRTHPSLVVEGERVRLYLSTGTTLVHSEATTALAFGAETEVLAPDPECFDTAGEPETCWDADAITEAEVRRARTATGQTVYRMFYAAHDGGSTELGFAASFDGLAFTRYAYNPVVEGTGNERSPTSVLAGDTYLLFWDEVRNPPTFGGIVRAEHVPSAPSDRW